MVGDQSLRVIWRRKALKSLEKICDYIAEDSPQNANNVYQDVLNASFELSRYPFKYAPDKYKKDNNGDYRYFELHKIRIAYFYDKGDTVEILRVNHTKQKPREY